MPGRTRGRMFDIRQESDEDAVTGSGSYPGYPGYEGDDPEGDTADDVDPGPHGNGGTNGTARNGTARNGTARNGTARNGTARNGTARNGTARNGTARNGTARNGTAGNGAARNGTARNGAAPNGAAPNGAGRNGVRNGGYRDGGAEAATTAVRAVPGGSGRFRTGGHDGRVAPDGRWDAEEPPLLSHRGDEPAYAREHIPQGFDGGDPDDPDWGRRPARDAAPPGDGDYGGDYGAGEYDEDEYGVGDAPLSVPPPGSNGRPLGPADVEELDPSMTDALARVDLGSIQVPVPYGAEMKLEPSEGERPQAVHLLLPEGRLAVSALAAPRSSGLWGDLAAEIEASLRKGGARVRNARGDWGRELHARTENAASVFVGCDGPRWMVYGVATASLETVEALDVELRRVLRGIIVVRGKSPYPPRTVLPLELPERLRGQQPEAAPPKASITVSVPVPAADGDDDEPASAGSSGATPAGGAPRPARPAAGPPSRPAPVEPATRALPRVQHAATTPVEHPTERTAITPRPAPPEAPAERTTLAGPRPAASDSGRTPLAPRSGPGRPGPVTGGHPTTPAPRRAAPAPPRGAAPQSPSATGPQTPPSVGPPPPPATGPQPSPPRAAREQVAPDPFEDAPGRPERAAVEDPAPPPARRDPAVTTLSAADLLAGTPADPAVRDRPAGPRHSGFGTGTGADVAELRDPDDGPGVPEPGDRDTGERPAVPSGPVAIEDIPLTDVPLLDAALDPAVTPDPPPAPEPEATGTSLPRRRRDRPVDDTGSRYADADTGSDEQGWMSAEIAASRRGGRHGAGNGWSVADILAAAGVGDTSYRAPRGLSGGGDDLFRSPAEAGEPREDGSGRRRRPAADPEPGPGGRNGRSRGLDGHGRHGGSGRSGPDDDTYGGYGTGQGVTGLADYRRGRRSAPEGDPAADTGAADGSGLGTDRGAGRAAAGGSGLTGRWSAERERDGDLGRHRRE